MLFTGSARPDPMFADTGGSGRAPSLEATAGRRCHDAVAPLHSCVYFAPEQQDELAALGLERGPMAYYAGRAAPLGAVDAGTVTATFYNFDHEHVRRYIPAAWRITTPEAVLAARHGGVMALVTRCRLERACRPTLFAASYGNLIGAAMTASWQEDQGGDAGPLDEAVTAVVAAVTARPAEPWTVEGMARLVHLSRSALGERFRRALGRGPAEVLREIRMREARRLLTDPSRPVEYIASAVGYGSTAAFSRAFSSHHGVAPQAWREPSPARDAQRGEKQPGRRGEPRAEQEGRLHAAGVQERAS